MLGKESCQNCGYEFSQESESSSERQPCPQCQSMARVFEDEVQDTIGIEDAGYKYKHKRVGEKKPLAEEINGKDLRVSDGRMMDKYRRIGRDINRYIETITDPETGEIVHHTDEPLDQHFGHGTAKFKNNPNAENI